MEPETDIPYPVAAVNDLANNYSAEHFRFAIQQCRDVIAQVIAEDNRSDQQIARVKLLRFLDFQLSRAVRWIHDEADLMASVLRSLIELKFWANFVSESAENATRFLNEPSIDAKELFERLEKLVPPNTYQQLQVQTIVSKRVQVEPTGETEAMLWKMCSKLVHPTAWVINDVEGTLQNPDQRKMLSLYIVLYGWGIVRIFHHINWS